jgi:hypothetical protein
MTTTHDYAAEARARLDAEMPNLPTVEQLAVPMLSTIYALHELQGVTGDAEFLAGQASPHAANLVQLVEDVASLIAAAVDNCIPRPYNGPGGTELRQIIFAVAQADRLRQEYHAGRAFDLAHRD